MVTRLLCVIALAMAAGCSTTQITTPEAMRDYVREKRMMSKFETFEVKRSYAAVTRDLKRRSDDCLAKEFQITQVAQGIVIGSRERNDGTTRYIPVSNIGPQKAEFYTKYWDSKARAINTPAGDKFVFYVADVTPKGKGVTSVDLYSWNLDRYKWAEEAVKAWARGEDPGCPTLNGMY